MVFSFEGCSHQDLILELKIPVATRAPDHPPPRRRRAAGAASAIGPASAHESQGFYEISLIAFTDA
jgi:hypothetical protein